MKEYILVKTFCNKKDIADKIIDTLLSKRLVAGSQVSEVISKYWWNNKLEEIIEYKLEFRSRRDKFKQIFEEIESINDYEVCEISSFRILDANPKFLTWIDECLELNEANMKFKEYFISNDEGKSNCVIRTFCKLFNESYDNVYNSLCMISEELNCNSFNDICSNLIKPK